MLRAGLDPIGVKMRALLAISFCVSSVLSAPVMAQQFTDGSVRADKTEVAFVPKEHFSAIPPSAPARTIYVVEDEEAYRQNFIISLVTALKDIQRKSPTLELPKVVVIDERDVCRSTIFGRSLWSNFSD